MPKRPVTLFRNTHLRDVERFTAAQAAQKLARPRATRCWPFTAAQAAQKPMPASIVRAVQFTAAQAAQKFTRT